MKLVRLGNKKCYLMEEERKGDLKKQLIQRWNIKFDKDYTFLTEDTLPEVPLCKLYLNTFGHNYYLYFTKLNGKPTTVMFDKWKEQAYIVRFRVDDILYYDTLFEGELIKKSDGDWIYQITDIISHEGEDVRHNELDDRIALIDNILKLQYNPDPVLEPSVLKRSLFVGPEHLEWLLTVYAKDVPYRCNGVNFKPQKYGEHYLFILEEYANKTAKSKPKLETTTVSLPMPKEPEAEAEAKTEYGEATYSSQPKIMEAVLALKKTDKPDVYELYANDGDDMLVQMDYAYIRDVEHSQQIADAINTTMKEYELEIEDGEYPEIPFLCQYTLDFNKWMPIEVSEEEVTIKSTL